VRVSMKKLLFLLVLFFSVLLFNSCENTSDPVIEKGSIDLTSIPPGAVIYIDTANIGKITPAVINDLEPGEINFTLKLYDYYDTTFKTVVIKNIETPVNINLVRKPQLKLFKEIWLNPGDGLDLSTGETTPHGDMPKSDIFYEGNNKVLMSQHLKIPVPSVIKVSHFYQTLNANFSDGTDSPVYQNDSTLWGSSKNNDWISPKYVFIYDSDKHYSKLIIRAFSWNGHLARFLVDVLYNLIEDDNRF
jgi:hypothetical protein